jgi:sugar phosphate isomerase/epimerase
MRAIVFTSLMVLAAFAAGAAPNPFFVFDNGLEGAGLTNIEAQLDLVKQAGFDGLSWRTDDPARVKQVLDGARRRGLKVFAIYANLDLQDDKLVHDPRLNKIIALCQGTDTMLWPNLTSKQFKPSDPAGDEVAVTGLRELADHCASNGVRIAIYPHVNMWIHRVDDAVRVVKKVNRPNVGLTFNLCHALLDGAEARVPAIVEAAAPHLFIATINGADRGAAPNQMGRIIQPLNLGTYDVTPVLKQLKAAGFKGPIGLQCYNIKGDPKVLLPAAMAAWRKMSAVLE